MEISNLDKMTIEELQGLFELCTSLYREYRDTYVITLNENGDVPITAEPILKRKQRLLELKTCVADLLCDKLFAKYCTDE